MNTFVDVSALYLYNIAEQLRLYGAFNNQNSLLDGKLGVAIFLYRYSTIVNDNLYAQYADGILDDYITDLSALDININVVCEIGIGFQYISTHNYAELDDTFFEDIDQYVYNYVIKKTKGSDVLTQLHTASYLFFRKEEVLLCRILKKISIEIKKYLKTITTLETPFLQFSDNVLQFIIGFLCLCLSANYQENNVKSIITMLQKPIFRNTFIHNRNCYSIMFQYICNQLNIKQQLSISNQDFFKLKSENNSLQDLIIMNKYEMLYGFPIPQNLINDLSKVVDQELMIKDFMSILNIKNLCINKMPVGLAWLIMKQSEADANILHTIRNYVNNR